MTWQEVINHPSLQDLPFKIELNAAGVIEMSPATNWHGLLQGEILSKLNELLKLDKDRFKASTAIIPLTIKRSKSEPITTKLFFGL